MVRFKQLAVLSLLVCAATAAQADSWSRADAEALLARWTDALVKYQVKGTGDKFVDGGVICPACNFEHGRTADSVYALVYRWRKTGETRYLDAAVALLDWTEHNAVTADGANYNDTKHYWRGITVFSQTSLGKTLLVFGSDLPADVRDKWLARFKVQTDYLVNYFNKGLADSNINYPITFCEAMALAYRLLGDEQYKTKADAMAALLKPLFLADGLLAGEGHPNSGTSPRGCRPVDFGYNLEESLPALYHYAELTGNAAILPELDRLMAGHFEFLLPDGGLDNSMGSRSCKWTYWGSRTSDGLLPAFAHYATRGGKGAVRAIDRHLALLRRCTSETGLLYGGLAYRDAGEPPCLHHTFAHVKSLVDLLLIAPPETAPDAPMPRENAYGHKHFASIDTDLVAVGPWRASFSANDNYSNPWGTDVGGGSLTMLWHPAFGPVCAATMNEYHYVEPTNFQDQRKYIGVLNLTPRVEREKFRSVADKAAKTAANFADGVFTYTAEGVLTSPSGKTGEAFKLAYTLTQDGLDVRATVAEGCRYLLPVTALPTDRITVEGQVATIHRAGDTIEVTADRPLVVVENMRGQLAFNPVAGLMALPLAVEGPGDVKLSLRVITAAGR